jgi:hypothetical protein
MVKIFCGNGNIIPPGYDQLGTRYECLKKGFGAGMYKSRVQTQIPSESVGIPWLIIGISAIVLVVIFVSYKRTKEKDEELKYGRAQ